MNRAERRKLKKGGGTLPPKEAVLTLKVSDFDKMIADAEVKAKERATKAALAEINTQILEQDNEYSLDLDSMVLWTLHNSFGFGKKRLEDFYREMCKSHTRLRKRYEMDDTYPERYLLKQQTGVDVEALNAEYLKGEENG